MVRLREVVFDSEHPGQLAKFWASALDGFEVRPYDDAEIAKLATQGLTPETDPSVMVDGPGLMLCFQKTVAPSSAANRLHLDLVSENRRRDVERLTALGASVVEIFEGHTWLRDPEGNNFCITDAQ